MSVLKGRRKKRVPSLRFTTTRGIGWHASYRDPVTNRPTRIRFGADKEAALPAYHAWLADHLRGQPPTAVRRAQRPTVSAKAVTKSAVMTSENARPGSLLLIASGLITLWKSLARQPDERPRRGTIAAKVLIDRTTHLRDFLGHINQRHGQGAVAAMTLADLEMDDVESYNVELVKAGYSSSAVDKRLQVVKALINRAGRKEHGLQTLGWNWGSRDKLPGAATKTWQVPSLEQMRRVLGECGPRERAIVWIAIGLGLGQRDLAALEVGTIDQHGYDLRRSKTGFERYGDTPPLVWNVIRDYLKKTPRQRGDLLFVTRQANPLVHGYVDSVWQWWDDLRTKIGENRATMGGFYMLRHLGATEFGSRPGCSIGAMKRWLGHGASSAMADRYMRPVAPEHRAVVEWVSRSLASGRYDL